MRSPLRKRLLRDLKGDLGKYISIFLLLTVTIGFVSGFLVADGSMIKAYNDSFEKYNIEDGHFETQKSLTDAQQSAIKAKDVTVYQLFYYEEIISTGATARIFKNRDEVDFPCVMEGRLAERTGEIAIDRMFADNNDLKVGDEISSDDFTYRIVGLVALSDYSTLFYDNNDMMFDAQKFVVALVSDDQFEEYQGRKIHYEYAWKYMKEPSDEAEEKEVADKLMEYVSRVVDLETFVPRYQNQAITFTGEDMGGDKAMMETLLYILVIITAFVFAITITNTIYRESNVIGTLRAMGYTINELVRHYMLMPLIVTLISAVIGNVVGYTFMKDFCASLYYGSYSLPTYETIWSVEALLKTTIIPAFIMMTITYVILRSRLSISPLKFLRRDLSTNRSKRAVKLNSAISFFNRFRIRVILQNMSNYAMLFIGLVFANILLFFGMMLPPLLSHFQETIGDNMLARYTYLINIPAGAIDADDVFGAMFDLEKLQVSINTNNPDAEKFSAYSLKTPESKEARQEEVIIYGVQEDSHYIHAEFDEKTVLISSAYADKYSLSKGDIITLKEPYEEKYYGFKVSGVYNYDGAVCVFMSMKHLNDTVGLTEDFFSGYFSDTEITDIDDKYLGTIIDEESLTRVSRQLDISMGGMMKLVDAFSIGLFMVLVYLLSKIIIEKNAQSISMAKILGYSDKEISKLYITPTNVLVVVFLLVSYPLVATILAKIFRVMLKEMMSGWIPIYLEPMVYLKMFALAMATYIVVATLEYRKIRNIPMDEALKNIE